MRAPLFATVFFAGCLSSPTGVARSWPPPLATTDVAAIATGDLDGDGTADVMVLVAGTADTGAGVYFLKGGVDAVASKTQPLESFTSYTPLDEVDAPAAGAMIATGASSKAAAFVYASKGVVQLAAFTGAALDLAGPHASDLTVTSGQSVWLREVAFPGGMSRLVVGGSNDLRHVDPTTLGSSSLTFDPLPSPGQAWMSPEVAVSYTSGSDQVIAVGSLASVDRAVIPTEPPPQGTFAWTNVRSGASWLGQTASDLGNGRDDILGYAAGNPGQLCAIDPGGTDTGSCVQTTANVPADVTVLAGTLTPDTMIDVALVLGGSGAASVAFVPNVTFDGTTLGGPPALPATATSIKAAQAALYSNGVLLVGQDGSAVCVGLGMGGVGACQ